MNELPSSSDDSNEVLLGSGFLISTLLAMGIAALLVWFALLRENQLFWRNVGGYPIWLRDLVRFTYLPLLVATVLVLMFLSMGLCAKICGSIRFFMLEALLLLACWSLISVSGWIAFRNNVTNLSEGRELHRHKP